MKDRRDDIRDDEIRIIKWEAPEQIKPKRPAWIVWICALGALLIIAAVAIMFFPFNEAAENNEEFDIPEKSTTKPLETTEVAENIAVEKVAYTAIRDTVVNDVELEILTPENAVPTLVVGHQAIHDSTAVLIVQAADIRGDNGKVVGAFVVDGQLLSKGEAKAGFCSIINGELTLGVADATPMLEKALMNDGYFFRQYPLVVGGQVVENKPKGKSIRRGLVELDGKISVIISRNRVSYHDFSEALTDIGVRNAIALVGGKACGSYRNYDGERFTFGQRWNKRVRNVNYLVWRQP